MAKKPRFEYGRKDINQGTLLSHEWETEKCKSSDIEIIPAEGYIIKSRKRSLDKTIYEAFATIFFSTILKEYSDLVQDSDFTLYSPQAVKFTYGDAGDMSSLESKLFEVFCPGIPLNKIQNSRDRDHTIDHKPVRVEHRVSYLTGILSEVLLQEGIVHGDPQLRHLILLPENEGLQYSGREGNIIYLNSNNGLGVIDCESARITGQYSEEVKKDMDKLKTRILDRYKHIPGSEEFFERGSSLIRSEYKNINALELSYQIAKKIFDLRFQNSAEVNMRNMTVRYK